MLDVISLKRPYWRKLKNMTTLANWLNSTRRTKFVTSAGPQQLLGWTNFSLIHQKFLHQITRWLTIDWSSRSSDQHVVPSYAAKSLDFFRIFPTVWGFKKAKQLLWLVTLYFQLQNSVVSCICCHRKLRRIL